MPFKLGRLRWLDKTIPRTRRTASAYDATGRWVEGTPVVENIVGNIQPFVSSGRNTQRLPDGLKTTDLKMLFTQDDTRTVDQYSAVEADSYFLEAGQEWVAFQIFNYTHQELQLYHKEVLLVRRDQVEA